MVRYYHSFLQEADLERAEHAVVYPLTSVQGKGRKQNWEVEVKLLCSPNNSVSIGAPGVRKVLHSCPELDWEMSYRAALSGPEMTKVLHTCVVQSLYMVHTGHDLDRVALCSWDIPWRSWQWWLIMSFFQKTLILVV